MSPSSMPITVPVALEVACHEAVVRQAYKDSVQTWTWSVGLTSATGHDVERYIGKPQTMEHCLAVYIWALNNYADDVRSKFKARPLTEAQFAAALSFHWNTGAIRQAKWVNAFLAGADRDDVFNGFMQWVTPKSITERRRKEALLFCDGVWSNDGKTTEYTRLTKASTPVWGSAVRVDIAPLVEKLLGVDTPVVAPKPLPPILVPNPSGGQQIETPAWTIAEHLANITASTRAIAQLTEGL